VKLTAADAFHVYVIGFTSLIVLPWIVGAARAWRLRSGSRRRVECPLCGKVAHPEPAIARVKCRGCGVSFEVKTERM
jgi:hypothetical protein